MSSRRSFLKESTCAIAGGLAAPAAAAGANGANDRIRLGLIGCGGLGRYQINSFLGIKGVEYVALCDVDAAQSEAALAQLKNAGARVPALVTKDFRRLLDSKDIDAVVIATPDHWHALPMVMACQAGKDVYVQKPLATSIGEGRVMVEAASKYKRVVQVGTQQRSGPQFEACVDFVRSGKLGQIRQVRCWAYLSGQGPMPAEPDSEPPSSVDYDFWLGPAPKRPFNKNRFHFNFRYFWDYSGGTMTDWGAHMIDIGLLGMNARAPLSAVTVGGKFGYPDDGRETPDTQQVLYEFPGWSMIWEHAAGLSHGPGGSAPNEHGVMFYGQNGVALVDRWGWEVFPEADRFPSMISAYRMAGVPRQNVSIGPAHEQNFIDCMRSRTQPRSDVESALDCMIACHIANMAARTGRKIRWNAAQMSVIDDPEAQKLVNREYRPPWVLRA